MRRVEVTIEGLKPYLQHRRPANEDEAKELKRITAKLQKDQYNEEAKVAEAKLGVYEKDGTYYIPASHIKQAMANAATYFRLGGHGRKTYKDAVRANVFPSKDELDLKTPGWVLDGRQVRIGRASIMRYRPRFNEWESTFELIITDDSLDLDVIKEILSKAGNDIGIGDYRPEFGLFDVKEFKRKN